MPLEDQRPDPLRADPAEMIEECSALLPGFNEVGLIPAVATDVASGVVLMLAWMNAEALNKTIETGQAWYWSRSRQRLWARQAGRSNRSKNCASTVIRTRSGSRCASRATAAVVTPAEPVVSIAES